MVAYQTSIKILDFQRLSENIRKSLIQQRKLLSYFLIHLKKMRVTFVAFNITGILFLNIPQNLIRNFIQIYGEYIMGMLHKYSTNIYFPVKYLLNENINDCKDSSKYICVVCYLLKTSFLLPHVFCNVQLELIKLISQHGTVIRDFNS